MFKFPVSVYSKVRRTKGVSESPIDLKALMAKDKRELAAKQAAIESAQFRADFKQKEKSRAAEEAMFHTNGLTNRKIALADKVKKTVPDQLLAEAFSNIYLKACYGIHDVDYVAEHRDAFISMAKMYIRKLGGMNYLKARLENASTPFLKDLYEICDESAKKIIKKKAKDIMNAITEDDAMNMLNNTVTDKDKNSLISKIDDLGADQLAELIRNKVVSVVRDEQTRERDEREMRTVLKNDLISQDEQPPMDGEEDSEETSMDAIDEGKGKKGKKKASKKEDKDTSEPDEMPEDMDDDEGEGLDEKPKKSKSKGKSKSDDAEEEPAEPTDDDTESEDKKSKSKKDSGKTKADTDTDVEEPEEAEPEEGEGEEEPEEDEDKKGKKGKKKAAKESLAEVLSRWNPITEQFDYNPNRQRKSLFFAMNVAIARDMMKSAVATEGKSITDIKDKKVPRALMESNPLNMDIFMVYLKDNQDGYKDIDDAISTEPDTIGSTEPIIDPDTVMSEALVQYTLLETAYTMKLIDVTQKTVMEQVDYLLRM